MKSFIVGLLTIIVLGIVGLYTFKATTKFMNQQTPSPSASPSPTSSAIALPAQTDLASADPTPYLEEKPLSISISTPKKTTTTTTTTTTTSHSTLTLVKTSTCPISYMTEIKDIQGPLTFRYSLNDGYSFGITVWKNDGNELINNTTYSGTSGTIKTISGVDYMKVRIESKTCSSTSDTWLTVTAER